jgi:hypothetical protein
MLHRYNGRQLFVNHENDGIWKTLKQCMADVLSAFCRVLQLGKRQRVLAYTMKCLLDFPKKLRAKTGAP